MILSRVAYFRCQTWTGRCLLSAVLGFTGLAASAQAQQTPEMVFEPAPGATSAQASASASGFPRSHIQGAPSPEDAGVGGFGVLGRVGHIAGNTVERNQSITYFDLSPYMFIEETYLFGEGRLFLTNQGKMGGSTGLGVRHYFPERDFVFGASAWYDRDDSRKEMFEQLGMSLELFSQFMDVRANYYSAIGDNVRELGTSIAPGSAAFTGHNITFATQTQLSTGADMVDLMFTFPVPGEIAQSMNLEASAGWYQIFTPSIDTKNINGYKLRVDADFLDRVVHFYSELTQDSFFDTNIVAGVDVNYWHHLESRPRFGSSQFNRIAQWVRRNRNVVTLDATVTNAAQVAINPNTGVAYNVNHVRNVLVPPPANFPAPAGTGTVDTPFQFIDEAQGGGADLIFVHADSVYDNRAVVLNDNELVLGEGVIQTIPVQGITQPLPLPRATNGANRPILQNTVGAAVTLADNNLFAGFDLNDTQGIGIIGSGIADGAIRDVRITTTTGANTHGVLLQNSSGVITLDNVNITGTEGNAFFVDGGTAAIAYSSGTITNTSDFAVLIQNNAGSVNMAGTTTNDTGGLGVQVIGSSGANTLGRLNLVNTNGNALSILNVLGSVSLFNDIDINGATGDAILIQNLAGSVSGLGAVDILNRNGVGVNLLNVAGTVSFADAVTMGTPNSGLATEHGINFQSSSGIVRFQDININGSFGSGINIGGPLPANVNTGQFSVSGFTTISDTIANGILDPGEDANGNLVLDAGEDSIGSAILVLNDSSTVNFTGTNISDRGFRGIDIQNHSGTTNFAGLNTISNALNAGDAAVHVGASSGDITFGTVIASDTVGPEPGAWIHDNAGVVTFASLNVESTLTTAVEITSNASVTIQGGTVDATGARGVTMTNNTSFGVVFDAVSSTNSDFGILVANNIALLDHPGSFEVLGDGQLIGSGGTVSGHTIAGASFFNVNRVRLGSMEFTGNADGVVSNDLNEFSLIGNEISTSTGFGIDILDNSEVLIERNNIFDNEGFNQIRIVAAQQLLDTDGNLVPYDFTIRDNTVSDSAVLGNVGAGDMIAISTAGAGNGSALRLLVEDNGRIGAGGAIGFASNRFFGDAAFSTVWNGDVLATIQGNHTRMSAFGGEIGFRIVTTRASAVNDILYTRNVLNDGGGSLDTGLLLDFAGSTILTINDNFGTDASGNPVVDGFTMGDNVNGGDTAIDMTFRATNNSIDISRNFITFNSIDGTAVLFRTISGPSSVNMDGNSIVLFDDGLLPDERGIVFQSVLGAIQLSSAAGQNNVIVPNGLFTVDTFIIPNGVSTGTLLINGVRLP